MDHRLFVPAAAEWAGRGPLSIHAAQPDRALLPFGGQIVHVAWAGLSPVIAFEE